MWTKRTLDYGRNLKNRWAIGAQEMVLSMDSVRLQWIEQNVQVMNGNLSAWADY